MTMFIHGRDLVSVRFGDDDTLEYMIQRVSIPKAVGYWIKFSFLAWQTIANATIALYGWRRGLSRLYEIAMLGLGIRVGKDKE